MRKSIIALKATGMKNVLKNLHLSNNLTDSGVFNRGWDAGWGYHAKIVWERIGRHIDLRGWLHIRVWISITVVPIVGALVRP